VDAIAQEVFASFGAGDLSPRDAQDLLGSLGEAAFHLYKPGSQVRRLMSPTGGRRQFNKYDKELAENRRRRRRRRLRGVASRELKDDDNDRVRIPICPKAKGGKKSAGKSKHKSPMNAAEKELQHFIDHLKYLEDKNRIGGIPEATGVDEWIEQSEAIIAAIPDDVEYYKE
jgi:hypothetical protein